MTIKFDIYDFGVKKSAFKNLMMNIFERRVLRTFLEVGEIVKSVEFLGH